MRQREREKEKIEANLSVLDWKTTKEMKTTIAHVEIANSECSPLLTHTQTHRPSLSAYAHTLSFTSLGSLSSWAFFSSSFFLSLYVYIVFSIFFILIWLFYFIFIYLFLYLYLFIINKTLAYIQLIESKHNIHIAATTDDNTATSTAAAAAANNNKNKNNENLSQA